MKLTNKILIVDDEPGIRDTMFYNLTDKGFTVDTAKNGLEGIEKIKQNNYDAVLSDIVMDGLNGVNLLEQIKEYDEYLPVVLLTGYASIETSIPAVNKGAFAYLKKPASIEEISTTLEAAALKRREDLRKEKVHAKYLKLLKYRKIIINEKLLKLFSSEKSMSNKEKFESLRRSAVIVTRNKTAKILILTHSRQYSENLTSQLKSAGFNNIGTAEELSEPIIKCRSIFLFDVEYYKENIETYINSIRKINPGAKIVLMVTHDEHNDLAIISGLNVGAIIDKPVRYEDILKIVSWESYLVESDDMKSKVNKMTMFQHIKSDLKYLLFKKVEWGISITILIIAAIIGIVISHPQTYIYYKQFNNKMSETIASHINNDIQKNNQVSNHKIANNSSIINLLTQEPSISPEVLNALEKRLNKDKKSNSGYINNKKTGSVKPIDIDYKLLDNFRKSKGLEALKEFSSSDTVALNLSNEKDITEVVDSTEPLIIDYPVSKILPQIALNKEKTPIAVELNDDMKLLKRSIFENKQNKDYKNLKISLSLSEWKNKISESR